MTVPMRCEPWMQLTSSGRRLLPANFFSAPCLGQSATWAVIPLWGRGTGIWIHRCSELPSDRFQLQFRVEAFNTFGIHTNFQLGVGNIGHTNNRNKNPDFGKAGDFSAAQSPV
jgi:hypothetical protein